MTCKSVGRDRGRDGRCGSDSAAGALAYDVVAFQRHILGDSYVL